MHEPNPSEGSTVTRRPKSALRILIEERMKGQRKSLTSFVKSERASGRSWQAIARSIQARTDVVVTGESLRNWFGETEPADTSA